MQKSVAGLTVALATVLALIVTILNAVLGRVAEEFPGNGPVNVSLHAAVSFSKHFSLQITVEEIQPYDLDHNGFLSEEELDQFPNMLFNFGIFRNIEEYMKITLQDASAVLKESGLNMTLEKLDEFDLDQDGFLSQEEITHREPRPPVTVFEFENQTGSLKDLARFLSKLSFEDDFQYSERELIELDTDHNGYVSFEEFDRLPSTGRQKKDPFSELIENYLKVSLEDGVTFLIEHEYVEATVKMLEQFDLDQDGFLCYKEINQIPSDWRPAGPTRDDVSLNLSSREILALADALWMRGGDQVSKILDKFQVSTLSSIL